jgi:hypothetical protein
MISFVSKKEKDLNPMWHNYLMTYGLWGTGRVAQMVKHLSGLWYVSNSQ